MHPPVQEGQPAVFTYLVVGARTSRLTGRQFGRSSHSHVAPGSAEITKAAVA